MTVYNNKIKKENDDLIVAIDIIDNPQKRFEYAKSGKLNKRVVDYIFRIKANQSLELEEDIKDVIEQPRIKELIRGDRGLPGKDADEKKIIEEVIKKIPKAKDGKNVDITEVVKKVLSKIDKPKDGIDGKDCDEKEVIKQILNKIPTLKDGRPPKHEVKNQSIRFENPDGTWGEWIHFGNGYGGGLYRGGGDTVVAGDSIVITENSSGSKVISAVLDVEDFKIPTVSVSGGGSYERGNTVNDVTLSWTCNKIMTTRTLSAPVPEDDREQGEGRNGEYTHEGADLTTNTTYTITVADKYNTATASTSVTFLDKVYYGTSALASLTNQQTLDLGGVLSARADVEFSIDGDGKYIYYLYPSEWGGLDVYVNGSINNHWDYTLVSITNVYGVIKNYNRYRSLTLQEGDNIIINIKV